MSHFIESLYPWYLRHRRDLPWRKTTDPYLIWVSETILQQTRVGQGLPYYERFILSYPDVVSLARAHEDEVLKLWEGLGYYSRARNLLAAAQQILQNFNGKFPSAYSDIRKLKGVGDYTAAAVASIAFNLPYAAVDGNVYRVLSRYYGLETPINTSAGKKLFAQLAEELLNRREPGMHNQALMEFGALQCVPKNPDCENCPLANHCAAFLTNQVDRLPVKNRTLQRSFRYFNFFLIEGAGQILIHKRQKDDIWKNLYQLPLEETAGETSAEEILQSQLLTPLLNKSVIKIQKISPLRTHELTHQRIFARFIHLQTDQLPENTAGFIKINKKDISKFAFPGLVKKYFEENHLI